MKVISITTRAEKPRLNPENTATIVETCDFLLSWFAGKKQGALYAQWTGELPVKWRFTEDANFVFETPIDVIDVLEIESFAAFRSMLARLGDLLLDNTFIGAGTFQFSTVDNSSNETRFAMFFSNLAETGFWAKIQVVRSLQD